MNATFGRTHIWPSTFTNYTRTYAYTYIYTGMCCLKLLSCHLCQEQFFFLPVSLVDTEILRDPRNHQRGGLGISSIIRFICQALYYYLLHSLMQFKVNVWKNRFFNLFFSSGNLDNSDYTFHQVEIALLRWRK